MIVDDLKAFGTLALLFVSYILVAVAAGYVGDKHGREQFHLELIKELDQKGGAPILLYPPDGEVNY